MEISNKTAGSVSTNNNNLYHDENHGYSPLTREKLYLLNLENNNKKHHNLSRHLILPASVTSNPTTQVTSENYSAGFNCNLYSQTPELSNSSSSSSLNSTASSVLEGEEDNSNNSSNNNNNNNDDDIHNNRGFYNYYNGSDSSIATIVQKLSSTNSDSTIDLENVDAGLKKNESTIEHHEHVISLAPINPPFIEVLDDDTNSITSASSIERHEIETETETDDDVQSRSIPRSLKSSLKLPSLTRSKSLPSTKTVRFSSNLEKVKTFNEYAKPSSISLENSPDQSPPFTNNFSNGHAYFDLKQEDFSLPWFDQVISSDEESEEDEENFYKYSPRSNSCNSETKWKLKSMNFDLFRQSDPSSYVKLISLNTCKESIVGVIQVLNLSFEKNVEVKFTVDNWKSIYIVNASYEYSINSNIDQFKFEINLNNSLMINFKKSKNQPINIELCIKYSSLNSTFYDNNDSSNFKFQLVSNKTRSNSSTSLNPKPRRYSQAHRLSDNLLINSSNSYIDDNFSTSISSSPSIDYSTNENYTTSRYFPDDTDYFNTKVFKSSTDLSSAWNYNSHGSTSSSSASTISSISSNSTISTTSNSSNETIKVATSNNSNGHGQSSNDFQSINAQSLQKSRQHYNEFLKKYCYFKSDDHKKDNESVFIR